MSARPTPEQIAEARAYFERPEVLRLVKNAIRFELGSVGAGHFDTIFAATEPPKHNNDVSSVQRPCDHEFVNRGCVVVDHRPSVAIEHDGRREDCAKCGMVKP